MRKGGIPQAIQKQVDSKWTNYPEWVGKKIDRESVSTDNAGRTSGAELVRRLPNVANNVSNEDFLGNILEPSGNPIRGRKESLAKAIAEEVAFDIILGDFQDEGPIFEAFSTNQERQGVEIEDVIKTDFARQVERGNVKLSLNKKEFNKFSSDLFHAASLYGITSDEVSNILDKIPTDERNKVKDFVFEEYIDLVAKLQKIKSGLRGVAYEKEILKVLKKLNIKGVEIINKDVKGFDPTGAGDINIRIGVKILNIEVKLNKLAQMGSFSVDFDPKTKTFISSQNLFGLEELFNKLKEKSEYFEEYTKEAEKLGVDVSKWPFKITKDQHEILRKGFQKKLTTSIETDQNIIEQLYNNKGVNYINIGKNGFFSLGDDNFNFGAPELSSKVKLTARLVRGGDFNRIRVFPTLLDFNQKSKYNIDNAASNNAMFTKYLDNDVKLSKTIPKNSIK